MSGFLGVDITDWALLDAVAANGPAVAAAAVALVLWLERKPTTWPLGLAAFLAIYGTLHLVTPVSVAAAWQAVIVAASIGIASKVKYRLTGFNLVAGDVVYLLPSGIGALWRHYRALLVASAAAAIALLALFIALPFLFDEPPASWSDRLVILVSALALFALALWLTGGPKRFKAAMLSSDRAHLTGFIVTLLGVGPGSRPRMVDIDDVPLPLEPPRPARSKVRPHIVAILHESTFDPRRFGLPFDGSLARFFTPASAICGALSVDVFGGNTMQTEFAVLTGLSSLSFGAGGRYVYHLLAGRLRHSLPSVLRDIGYRTALVSCDSAGFVGCGAFYRSIGIDTLRFAEELPPPFDRPRWERERHDALLYDEALKLVEPETPGFLAVTTLMNHGHHDAPLLAPDRHAPLREAMQAAGGSAEFAEYMVRLAESAEAYEAFCRRLLERLAGAPLIILRYGDHAPPFLAGLTGKAPGDPELRRTFFAIEAHNMALPADLEIPETLDAVFLSTVVLQAAGLPLDAVGATRASLLRECGGSYFDTDSPRKRRFHRTLVDAGLIDLG